MLLLDTCAIIYDALEPERLSPKSLKAINAAERSGDLICSDISLWEIAMLVQKDRLNPGTDAATFIRLALMARSIEVLPITPEIAARSSEIDLHGDPADRIIAATALENNTPIVTSDRRLLKARNIPTLW